jgi:hypothetical protein
MVPTRWRKRARSAAVLMLVMAAGCASKGTPSPYAAPLTPGRPDLASAVQGESKAEKKAKAKQAHEEERLRRLQAELIARGDPDSLGAAALIARTLTGVVSPSSLELATSAYSGAATRADLAYLLLQMCEREVTCDPQPLEARVRLLDPDNGISWLYVLVRATRDNDLEQRDTARAGLAQSQRVDLYWNKTVSRLTAAAAGKAGFAATDIMVELIGIEAALPMPLQPVSRACSAQEIQQPEVLTQCRRIAAAFRQGDTRLLEIYGSSLAARLWPADSAESRSIATERRALHYQMDLMTRNAAKVDSPQATQTLAGYFSRYPTEQAAFRALYVQLGLNPDPPATWVDTWKED